MKNKVSYFRRSVLALVIISLVGMSTPLYAKSTVKDHRTDAEKMDSIENTLPYLEQKVLSTLMSGASKPVQFSGEARLKGQYHLFTTYPDYLGPHTFEGTQNKEISGDQSYLQTGWEASVLRFGLVVRAGRNTILWSRFGFSHTFPGNRVPDYMGDSPSQEKHNATGWATNVFEDMCAGIAIRTVPVSFWLKMGNILWTEASPFTIWKAQGRMFGWEYLPYEIEQPISRYYEYNIAKGEKIGRAAWHKKAFDGINLESINMPLDFYLNLVYGKFMEYDKFEREYMDFATDLAYAAEDDTTLLNIIETGYGDSYRHIFHTRFAKKMKNVTLGLNYNNVHVSEDIIYAQSPGGIFFNNMFNLQFMDDPTSNFYGPKWFTEAKFYSIDTTDTVDIIVDSTIASHLPSGYIGPGKKADTVALDCGKGFYKECQAFSVDLRGNIGSKFELHADIGLSKVDTNWIYGDTIQTLFSDDPPIPITIKKRETTSSNFLPAIYAKLKFKSKVILESDLVYISKGFYSPFSLACPMDAFYAFGTNLLGAGTFVGPSEASPYFQNMAGGWLSVSPQLRGYGHFKVKYGQHLQLKEARDLLFFPYRLIGMDLNSILLSTYTKWGVGTIDFPMEGVKYDRRLGDESYEPTGVHIEEGPEKGGLKADYLSVYEGFVPYTNPLDVLMNYKSRGKEIIQRNRSFSLTETVRFVADEKVKEGFAGINEMSIDTTMKDTVINGETVQMINVFDTTGKVYTDLNGFVPMHKKYSFNFEIDGSYDIGPLLHYKKDFFVGGYLGISGVSTHPKAFSFNEKDDDVLLWSLYLRLEPAIALSKKFYIIGLYGYETWRSDKAWMNVNRRVSNNEEDINKPIFQRVPINYNDVAWGLGFDWDALDRVGLHTRFKWMKHKDVEHDENNMKWFLISMEITTFF